MTAEAIRPAVAAMAEMAPVPMDEQASQDYVEEFERRCQLLQECAPLTDAEASALMPLFAADEDDTLFALMWTVLHIVETAPWQSWRPPPPRGDGTWQGHLRARRERHLGN